MNILLFVAARVEGTTDGATGSESEDPGQAPTVDPDTSLLQRLPGADEVKDAEEAHKRGTGE